MTHAGIHPGRGSLRFDARLTPPELSVDAGWDGERYAATGAVPAYTGGSQLRFALNGLDIVLRYVVVIASDPE